MPTDEKKSVLAVKDPTGISTGDWSFGFPTDSEYLARLQGTARFTEYRQMWMSDGGIRAIGRAYQLPLQNASWNIEGENETLNEEAEFIWNGWQLYLKRALLFPIYGAYAFEQLFDVVGGQTVETACLPRPPFSWYLPKYDARLNGKLVELTQIIGAARGKIPAERLVMILNADETDSVLGSSFLRPAYKHYDIVQYLERLDSVGLERFAIGVPMAMLASGIAAGSDEYNEAKSAVRNVRGHEAGYFIGRKDVIASMEIVFNDYKNDALLSSVQYHRRMMFVSALAQFLDLGQGTGSYALSKDQTELFLLAVGAVGKDLAEQTVNQRIKRVLEFNHSDIDPDDMPTLTVANIDRAGSAEISQLMTAAGIKLTQTVETEQHLRSELGWPQLDDGDIAALETVGAATGVALSSKRYFNAPRQHDAGCQCGQHRRLSDGVQGAYWRDLRPEENALMLAEIDDGMDDRSAKVWQGLQEAKLAQIRAHNQELRTILSNDRTNTIAIQDIMPTGLAGYKSALQFDMSRDMDFAADAVARELYPTNRAKRQAAAQQIKAADKSGRLAELMARTDNQAEELMRRVTDDYRQIASQLASDQSLSVDEIIRQSEAATTSSGARIMESAAAYVGTTPIQFGRQAAAETLKDDIDFGIYSAILDGNTCPYCFEADGTKVSPESPQPDAPNPKCEGRDKCRCVIIWVLKVS